MKSVLPSWISIVIVIMIIKIIKSILFDAVRLRKDPEETKGKECLVLYLLLAWYVNHLSKPSDHLDWSQFWQGF